MQTARLIRPADAFYNGRDRMTYFRPAIDALAAYEPGEQPPSGSPVIKLNTNENPYPPSPAALEELHGLEGEALRTYPHPYADEFRQAAAEVLQLDPEWLLVGNGSDELLTMLMRAVAAAERSVTYPVPTYVLYRTLAGMQQAPVVEVEYDDTYVLPTQRLADVGAALTIVANPNSPSGSSVPTAVLGELATRVPGILAVDEAYVAFADASAVSLTEDHDNVIVLRTLSKSHSLAGLRLGFGIAQPALLAGLAKVKDSYNVGAVAARVGAAAIRDTRHTADVVARVKASRTRLAAGLTDLGFHVWPSDANFLLVRPSHADAAAIYESLKDEGILVRYFSEPRLAHTLRITVGTDPQNDRLLAALRR